MEIQKENVKTFKERLEFYMIKRGLNPTSLAKRARLNITAIRDILQHEGSPHPRIDTFIKLCLALDVKPHHLSPEIAKLYSSRQRRFLDEMEHLDERHDRLKKKIDKEKNGKKPATRKKRGSTTP